MPAILSLLPSVANYRVGMTLAGIQYLIDMQWNSREEAWYMSILSEDARKIAIGIKIVLGTFLGLRSTHPEFPPGFFRAFDRSGQGVEATFDDLGDNKTGRVVVYFFSLQEIVDSL